MAFDPKEQVRLVYEAFETGKTDILDDVVAPDSIDYNPLPGQPPGIAGLKHTVETLRNALSGLAMNIRSQFVDGDTCITRSVVSGTHVGTLLGLPATGRHVSVELIDIVRFGSDGKAVERWGLFDLPAMLVQLGIVPAPEQ